MTRALPFLAGLVIVLALIDFYINLDVERATQWRTILME